AAQLSYVLHVKVTPPGCGDAIVQSGEQCDDGNTAAGDGCSPACQLEGDFVVETESDDTPALANSVSRPHGPFRAIAPVGDHDDYSFDVTVPGSVATITIDDGTGKCPHFDSRLTLFDASSAQIATDNDVGIAPCSAITPSLYPAVGKLGVGKYTIV